MIEQFMAWLDVQYNEAVKVGNKSYPRELVAFQRGREMAFYVISIITLPKRQIYHGKQQRKVFRGNKENELCR